MSVVSAMLNNKKNILMLTQIYVAILRRYATMT